MNTISLVGRTTAPVELKKTSSGKSVVQFTLAVKRKFAKDTTDWIPVVAWEKTADMLSQYVTKGQQIAITGELQSRHYEDKNGSKRTAYEVIARDFDFCGSKNEASGTAPEYSAPNTANFEELNQDDDLPFN